MIMVPTTHTVPPHAPPRGRAGRGAGRRRGLVASGQAAATAPLDAQQRVSQMGPDGDLSFVAGRPSVAYNPRADQYLAVWSGNAAGEELEIWGRFSTPAAPRSAASSASRPWARTATPTSRRPSPTVAYNPRTNEYLVAWQGWDLAQTPGAEEVFVQRLSAAGAEVGADDARISLMGPEGDLDFDAQDPAITRRRLGRVPRRVAG